MDYDLESHGRLAGPFALFAGKYSPEGSWVISRTGLDVLAKRKNFLCRDEIQNPAFCHSHY
jgi:hypothetical protein